MKILTIPKRSEIGREMINLAADYIQVIELQEDEHYVVMVPHVYGVQPSRHTILAKALCNAKQLRKMGYHGVQILRENGELI